MIGLIGLILFLLLILTYGTVWFDSVSFRFAFVLVGLFKHLGYTSRANKARVRPIFCSCFFYVHIFFHVCFASKHIFSDFCASCAGALDAVVDFQ